MKLQEEVKNNKSIDQAITNFKPLIFWKDKEIVKQQMNQWSLEKINNMITLDFEYVMMIVVGFYILFYYCLCDMRMDKPDFKNILLLVGFHSAHLCIVKKFYKQGDTAIAMLLVLAPMILYKMYSIYQRKQQKEHDMKMAMIMAQLQA